MGHIIGIDLGTTNSCVAVMEGKDPVVLVNEEGNRTTPSVVAYVDGDVLVGSSAKRQAIVNPESTVHSVKRFIGSKYKEIADSVDKVTYNITKSKNGDTKVKIDGKSLSPPEISAKVLQKLKKAAEAYLGEEVSGAVVTVPAYFNDSQRQATKDAGKIAGLDVKRIINEPTAAALAYGLDKKDDQLVAVYDFGGGTFDVSILEISEDVVEVLSTAGDTHLGGDNVDEVLIEYILKQFESESGITVSEDTTALQRIREAAEKAKISLSSTFETTVNLPFLTADASGPKHLDMKLSRSTLEELVAVIIEKTFKSCKQALKDASKSANDINQVVLVGGSTRMPLVLERVEKFFGKKPHQGVNPDEVVALGAAIQGGVLAGNVKDVLLLDVTPLSLGIETMGGVSTTLIQRNTTVPAKKSEIFSTAQDGQPQVEIHVLQGERSMAADNRTLGRFELDGIPPAPRGIPQIEVTFDIDADGIINVSAKDKASGKEQSVTITNSSGLSDGDIDRMVKEANQYEAEDTRKKELIETRNKLDGMIHHASKMKSEFKEKLSENDVSSLDSALEDAKKKLDSDSKSDLDEAISSLNSVTETLVRSMYETSATSPEEAVPPGTTSTDDVVDAEIIED